MTRPTKNYWPASRASLTLAIAATLSIFLSAKTAQAQTYNAGADLRANELPDLNATETLNPNPKNGGVWSYGERPTALGPGLTLYTAGQHFNNANDFDGFAGAPISNGNLPHIYVNTGSLAGSPGPVGPGEMLLHPDGDNGGGQEEKAVVRFTAPTTGAYNVHTYFADVNNCCNGTGADVHVVKNAGVSTSLFSGNTSLETGAPLASHASTVSLNAGNSLDFVVGTGGQLFGDGTRMNAMISAVRQAPIVNVDFNGFNPGDGEVAGPGFTGNGVLRLDGTINTNPAAGPASGVWNQVSVSNANPNLPSMTTGFVDGNGAATGVTVSLSGFAGADDCPGCQYGAANSLLRDYLVQVDNTAAALTIGGLTPGAEYDLYLYTTNNGGGGGGIAGGGTFSVNGDLGVFSTGDDANTPFTDYLAMGNYIPFLGVEANGLGQLVISATGEPAGSGGAGISIINGFQLQLAAVPEPASIIGWLVAGVAVCGYGLRRARRRLAVETAKSSCDS